MPTGTPLEDTAKVLREIGTEIAQVPEVTDYQACLLYTSDAADERSSVDLGGRRIIKKKKKKQTT